MKFNQICRIEPESVVEDEVLNSSIRTNDVLAEKSTSELMFNMSFDFQPMNAGVHIMRRLIPPADADGRRPKIIIMIKSYRRRPKVIIRATKVLSTTFSGAVTTEVVTRKNVPSIANER